MPTNAQWLAKAKKLYTTTFKHQTKNTVVLSKVKRDYDTQELTVIASDTITVARVYDVALGQLDNSSIKTGDKMIGILNENLTVTPSTDNVNCVVNGVDVKIKGVSIDEAGAVWTLHVSDK